MWDEQKRQRFQQLRQRESQLADDERAELASLVHDLEVAESGYLGGATERMGQERQAIEKQNCSLRDLAMRRQALVQRLESVLAEARTERRAIESELASVVANSRGSNTVD
jgi:5-methylcytosine-specific restriction endonuclease McrA